MCMVRVILIVHVIMTVVLYLQNFLLRIMYSYF